MAWTEFINIMFIVVGLAYIAWIIGGEAGGAGKVIAHAREAGKLRFLPEPNARDVLWFAGAAVTMMFGSIPQQDVFQRVCSARTVRIAVWGAVLGGVFYFLFAFVPIFIGYSASLLDPQLVRAQVQSDPQRVLPLLILKLSPVFAQIMFFGALLSAIMSTASGTLLAPSVIFTENVLKKFLDPELSDRGLLWAMRGVVACFAVIVTMFALNTESSIYEMVGNAYKVTLVGAFVPLLAGLYWDRASPAGALASIVLGLSTWLALEYAAPDALMPPQLGGLFAAAAGMVVGSLATQRTRTQAAQTAA